MLLSNNMLLLLFFEANFLIKDILYIVLRPYNIKMTYFLLPTMIKKPTKANLFNTFQYFF